MIADWPVRLEHLDIRDLSWQDPGPAGQLGKRQLQMIEMIRRHGWSERHVIDVAFNTRAGRCRGVLIIQTALLDEHGKQMKWPDDSLATHFDEAALIGELPDWWQPPGYVRGQA